MLKKQFRIDTRHLYICKVVLTTIAFFLNIESDKGSKRGRLEECMIVRMLDWKSVRLEECKIGKV